MMWSTASGLRASTSSLDSAQVGEELGFADDARLDDFVEPGAVFALGQGVEDGGVDEHGERLVEAADQVLAADQIDAGLAADGGVHLGEQRGGDLQDGDAAHEDGGQEAAHVVDDAAAESDHHAGAIGAELHHLLGQLLDGREALLIFAARQVEYVVRNSREAGGELRAGVTPDILGGDDEDFPGLGRNVLRGPPDHAALHDGGIAALRRYDLVSWHTPFYHAISGIELGGDVGMAVLARNGGGRTAVVRRVGGVGAGVQEQGDDFAVPAAGGGVQRRHAVGLFEVGVRAAFQQKGGQRPVAGGRRRNAAGRRAGRCARRVSDRRRHRAAGARPRGGRRNWRGRER